MSPSGHHTSTHEPSGIVYIWAKILSLSEAAKTEVFAPGYRDKWMFHVIKSQSTRGLFTHLHSKKTHGRGHFPWHKIFHSLRWDASHSMRPVTPRKPKRHAFLVHPAHTLTLKCFPGRDFLLERFSSSHGFAWKFKDEVWDFFFNPIVGFWGGKQKCYVKINRRLPRGDICLWWLKATMVLFATRDHPAV